VVPSQVLAIGDGANDVGMIQEAHVGVAIHSDQIMIAVHSADFAIPDFKSLWRLLFYHGRLSYIRNAEMLAYFLWKNMIFTTPLFIFCFYNGYSGSLLYDDYYITFFNFIFTCWPIIVKSLFDKDFDYHTWTTEPRRAPGHQYNTKKLSHPILETKTQMTNFIPYLYSLGQRNG
jgi:phospholipid-translocating ATPase